MTFGEKEKGICSDENMEDGNEWKPKEWKTKTKKNMKLTGNVLHPSAYSVAISVDLHTLYY